MPVCKVCSSEVEADPVFSSLPYYCVECTEAKREDQVREPDDDFPSRVHG